MNPTLLHQLADDRVIERRRHHHVRPHPTVVPRARARPATRLRVVVGGLLIAAGTRLAGPHTAPAALRRHPSSPA